MLALVVVAVVERANLVAETGAWASELLVEQQEGLAVLAAERLGPLVAWTASFGACTRFAAAGCSTDAAVALVGLLQRVLVAAAELLEELLAAAAELLGELLAAAAGLGRALVGESFAR